MIDAVVKVGGSLGRGPGLAALGARLAALGREHRLLLVPGGGAFADLVREHEPRFGLRPGTAHWMAVLAMDQHAELLAGLAPAARLVGSPEDVAATVVRGRLAILAPGAWLRAEDPLPHGWHVTSDSIAAWVAARLAAQRLVLLKSVDGVLDASGAVVPEVHRDSPELKRIVDAYFSRALGPHQECWILSGRHPERLAELFEVGKTRGTRVRARPA